MIGFISNIDHALSRLKTAKPYQFGGGGSNLPPITTSAAAASNPGNFRYAQSQVTYTQPQFYSPLHTPQNWQIPSKRREIYQWAVINPFYVISYDNTFKRFNNIDYTIQEIIEDSKTNSSLFNKIDCEPILDSIGNFSKPSKMSIRDCIDKDAVEMKCIGYWRSLHVTAEHIQLYLDGKLYRHKLKLKSDARWRERKGIKPGGDKPFLQLADNSIKKIEANKITLADYLLYPVQKCGNTSLLPDEAWIIGQCISDGCRTKYSTIFTKDKNENQVKIIEKILTEKFISTVRSYSHGEGNGWRVTISNKEASNFFSNYITGKRTEKKFTKETFELDKESRLHLLGGYFDGDGCFSKQEQTLIAVNYSCDMADQIYALLLSVGIRCSLNRYPVLEEHGHYPTDSKWFYVLMIPSSDVLRLSPYMRGNKVPKDFVPPKERNLRFFYEENGITYLAQPIEYIKQYKYTGKAYDLEICPEHAYVANGYVTSNCRYFVENEPKVAAAIDFYSSFPMNGFETQCDDSKIKHFYDHLNKKLNLDHWCKMISREYYLIGDVFPFLEVSCDTCRSTGVDKHGKPCTHKGGTFNRLVVLNPDWIDVQANQFAADPVITLLPDDDLKKVVWHKRPKEIYDRLLPHLRQLILAGKPIPLDNTCVTHLKHNPYPYGVYGTSLIRRLLKTLTYKDKLMTAQWIVAERLILPIRVVKVGNAERPAGPSDIADVQQQLAQTATDPNLTLVTHHAFDYEWYGSAGKVLTLSNEFELINQEILQGLMINDALLSGNMGSYSSAAIGAEALIQRMESWRLELARYIEDRIYKPIAEMRGFVDETASKELGETVYVYPKIKWNDLNLRDDTQIKQLWMQLHDKQVLSAETMCEKFDLDYDQEVERLRFENAQQQMAGGATAGGAAGGMGGMGIGGMGGGGGIDMGGGMGGPPGEMGGLPGGGGTPGAPAEMGGGMGGTGMGSPAGGVSGTAQGGSEGKILTRGKASKLKPAAEEIAQPSGIRLTSLEQIMFKTITNLQNYFPFRPWIQYPLGKYRADFAIPQLKLAIECDGGIWHENPEKQAKDKVRDSELAKYGWTTLRFSETELKEKQPEIQKTVAGVIYKLWKRALSEQKKQKDQFDQVEKAASEIIGKQTTGHLVLPEGLVDGQDSGTTNP